MEQARIVNTSVVSGAEQSSMWDKTRILNCKPCKASKNEPGNNIVEMKQREQIANCKLELTLLIIAECKVIENPHFNKYSLE